MKFALPSVTVLALAICAPYASAQFPGDPVPTPLPPPPTVVTAPPTVVVTPAPVVVPRPPVVVVAPPVAPAVVVRPAVTIGIGGYPYGYYRPYYYGHGYYHHWHR